MRQPTRFLVCLAVLAFGLTARSGLAANCVPTPNTGPGGNYAPPKNTGGKLGKGLRIEGHIVSAKGCAPVAGAIIESWQADHDGQYTDRLRTVLRADKQGRFAIETEWPNFQPPHVHFHVVAPGFQRLVTIWQFETVIAEANVRLVLSPAESPPR